MRSVVIITNEFGKCTKVLELTTLTEVQIANYKKEADEEYAKAKLLENEKLKAQEKEDKKVFNRCLMIAKTQYDALVDRGEISVDEDFEKMFASGEIDLAKCPVRFNEILGRIY